MIHPLVARADSFDFGVGFFSKQVCDMTSLDIENYLDFFEDRMAPTTAFALSRESGNVPFYEYAHVLILASALQV